MGLGSAIVGFFLLIAALVLTVQALTFTVECMLSLLPDRKPVAAPETSARYVVIVPAHDESAGLGTTLEALRAAVDARGSILVVADNCTDDTADVARRAGVNVVERVDLERRGKGYAIVHAAKSLEASAPDVLVFVDADCLVEKDAVRRLVDACIALGRPVQADYTLVSADDAAPTTAISNFAFLVRNRVRPRGLALLSGPCGLFGTGMAMPYELFASLPSADAHLVEDMWLGVECALRGFAPRFVPEARVTSASASASATVQQRTRWEHGHLGVMLHHVPRLLASFDREAFLLGLDLSVPPLSLFVVELLGFVVLSGFIGDRIGVGTPFSLALASLFTLSVGVLLAWLSVGREILPWRVALSVPRYVLWKLPIYARFFGQREGSWVRTEREKPES